MNLKYPKYENVTVTIFPRHLEWLNARFYETGISRSAQVREALELLIAKGDQGNHYEAPEVILNGDDEGLKQLGAEAQCAGASG